MSESHTCRSLMSILQRICQIITKGKETLGSVCDWLRTRHREDPGVFGLLSLITSLLALADCGLQRTGGACISSGILGVEFVDLPGRGTQETRGHSSH